jgi:inositol-1,3,4-trisphosphate 5/6-kinase/inositol-tetrakisphosphate 1-kinase
LTINTILGKVGVPRQLVITKDPSSIPYEVAKSGLKLPLGVFHVFPFLFNFQI